MYKVNINIDLVDIMSFEASLDALYSSVCKVTVVFTT